MPKKLSFRELVARIKRRARTSNKHSYTRQLIRRGRHQIGKKLGEEGVELAIAGIGQSKRRVVEESADLLYIVAVLLHVRDVSVRAVEAELGKRVNARTNDILTWKTKRPKKKKPRGGRSK